MAEFEPLGILHLHSMQKALSVLREKWINKGEKQDYKKATQLRLLTTKRVLFPGGLSYGLTDVAS